MQITVETGCMCSQSYGAEHSAAEMFQNSRPSAAPEAPSCPLGHLPIPRGCATSPQLSTPRLPSGTRKCSLGLHPSAGNNIFLLWNVLSLLWNSWNFRSPTACSPACFDSWNSAKGLRGRDRAYSSASALCRTWKGDLWSLPARWLYSGRDRVHERRPSVLDKDTGA